MCPPESLRSENIEREWLRLLLVNDLEGEGEDDPRGNNDMETNARLLWLAVILRALWEEEGNDGEEEEDHNCDGDDDEQNKEDERGEDQGNEEHQKHQNQERVNTHG